MNGGEELKGLWIGQSSLDDDHRAKINDGEWTMAQAGEIILRGQVEAGLFVLEDVSRIAFAGVVIDGPDNPYGKVTIIGPLDAKVSGFKPVIEQDDRKGIVSDLRVQVHYRQLTIDAIKRNYYAEEESDTRLPLVVRMKATLNWEQIEDSEGKSVWLAVNLSLEDDQDYNLGNGLTNLATTITLDQELKIEFYSVEDALPDDSPEKLDEAGRSYRLCALPNAPCAGGAIEMLIRRLPIRFVCLFAASPAEQTELVGLCATQVDGVCAVWRNQAILAAKVAYGAGPVVEFADHRLAMETFTDSQAGWTDLISKPTADDPLTIDVFIVREVKKQNGSLLSGVSYNLTVASAGVVLPLWALRDAQHQYLLAHELGHCLGLGDTGIRRFVGQIELPQGSPRSVMQIMRSHAPLENTADNCTIFGENYHGLLSPLARVVLPLRKDCLRPRL